MCRLALVVGLVLGCGCGAGDGPEDVGDACVEVGDALCERAAECGALSPAYTLEQCATVFWAGCCGDSGTCGKSVNIDGSEWATCIDDLGALACSNISADTIGLPGSCLRIDF